MRLTTLMLSLCLFTPLLAFDTYRVKVKGHYAGKAQLTIDAESDHYQVHLALFPVIFAKLFGIDDMIEVAQGKLIDNHYFPHTYQRTGKKNKKLLMVNFLEKQAIVKQDNKEKHFDIKKIAQDPLSQIAQIRHDLQQKQLHKEYFLVTDKGQQRYTASRQGNHVTLIQMPSKRYRLQLWFAEDLTLIGLQKEKQGKIHFSMNKIKIKGYHLYESSLNH